MIEPRTNPIHLYRALLRECTYLPDPRARTFFQNYTISSFRKYLPKIRSWRHNIPLERQVRLLDRGRKQLSMLRRANEGYLKPLEKVLMITYGRVGKRRRQIMFNLMREETPQSRELAADEKIEPYKKDWSPLFLVQKLMQSQAACQGQLDRSTARVKPKLQIPEQTIWKKELPPSRARNAVKKWYVRNVDLILPPLPEKEWLELRGKATGTIPWPGPIERRRKAAELGAVRESIVKPEVLLDGPEKGETFKKYVNGRPHRITRRVMQRLWAVVFKHTPLLVMDKSQEKLVVHWEEAEGCRPSVAIPSQQQASILFGDWKNS